MSLKKSVDTTELTVSGYDSTDFMNTQNEQSCGAMHLGRRAVFQSNLLPQLQFKNLVPFYQTTRCQVQEDTNMHGHRCRKTKSHMVMLLKFIQKRASEIFSNKMTAFFSRTLFHGILVHFCRQEERCFCGRG